MIEHVTLEFIDEHEDGSASYGINMTKELSEKCHNYGLRLVLYCGALGCSPADILRDMERQIGDEVDG
jgi:hypothetical protein